MSNRKICYRCHQERIVKNGISSKGYQKYRCSNCGHSYTSKTEYVIRSNASRHSSPYTNTNTAVHSQAGNSSTVSGNPATASGNSLSRSNNSVDTSSVLDFIMTIAFGWTGYWRFRKGQVGLGVLWLLTGGVCFIGWLVDIIQAYQAFSSASKTSQNSRNMQQSTSAYIPPSVPTHQPPPTALKQPTDPSSPAQPIPPAPTITLPQPPKPAPSPAASRPNFAEVKDGNQLTYSYEDVELYTLPEQMPDFSKVRMYGFVDFIQEPENPYDSNAVYVMLDDIKLGYLYKGTLQQMVNDFIRRGDKVIGFVSGIDSQNHKFQIDMGFYQPEKENV